MISPTQASRPVFAIVISEKGGAERRESFERSEISVGRVQGNDLMLPKGNVSKRHARLIFRDGRFIVTDLNSTNGTYVNRRRISQATIVREGDRIYIGDFVLRIEIPEGESQARDLSEATGSGPVVARESAADHSGATHMPEEDSGATKYPEVPGPPRVPSGPRMGSGADSSRDSQPSGHSPSMVDVSHADIDARAVAPSNEDRIDQRAKAVSEALATLVERAAQAVGPQALDGDVTDALRSAVDRALGEGAQSLTTAGDLEQTVDADKVVSDARAELLELGPLGPLLVDASVTSIAVTRFDSVVALRGDRAVPVVPGFSSPAGVQRVLGRLCRAAGDPLRTGESVIDRVLRDGSRLSAVLGAGLLTGPLLVIEKPHAASSSLEDLVRRGTISRAIATFLHHCVAARVNVLVVGPRDAGTAAVLSALVSIASEASPVVAVRGTDDLASAGAPSAAQVRGDDVDVARIIATAAHVPDVRLVAELAGAEVVSAVIDATGEGVDGVVAVAHAAGLRRALMRLAADVVERHSGAPINGAREWVAAAFDVLVEVGRLRDGRHRVMRVAEMGGVQGDEIRTQDIFTFHVERTAAGGAVEGTFIPSGTTPRVAEEVSSRGFSLESSMFTRPPSR